MGVGENGVAIAVGIAVADATGNGGEVGVRESVEMVVRGTVVVTSGTIVGVGVSRKPSDI